MNQPLNSFGSQSRAQYLALFDGFKGIAGMTAAATKRRETIDGSRESLGGRTGGRAIDRWVRFGTSTTLDYRVENQ